MTTSPITIQEEYPAATKFVRDLMPDAPDEEIDAAVERINEYVIFLYKYFIVEQRHLPVEQRKIDPLLVKVFEK